MSNPNDHLGASGRVTTYCYDSEGRRTTIIEHGEPRTVFDGSSTCAADTTNSCASPDSADLAIDPIADEMRRASK